VRRDSRRARSASQPVGATLDELRERLAEVNDVGRARALLGWDERTHMPPAGAEVRSEQLATLARIRHRLLISDELGRLIDAAARETESLPYESDEASLVRVARRGWEKARRVPADMRAEMTRVASVAEHAWAEARANSDFAGFLPYLRQNVELRRRYADCYDGFEGFEHEFDPLLDDFEPGMTTPEISAVLGELRDGIRPLITAVAGSEEAVDDSCLHGDFPLDAQETLAREVVAELPLQEGAWRLDQTVHPFATAISPADLRITTRFDPEYVGTAVWSVIHESGHAMYENGVPRELWRSPLASPSSLGFHESQSRLWENWVGRSRAYLEHLLPRLQELFPERLGAVDVDGLYRAANKIEPSLIRVEADQVTYNLHIILRFELELEIFSGAIDLADLPEAWDAKVQEYLGISVPDDAQGVLQDVHWAGGMFGYFPTYSLGNVIAGQLWDRITAEMPDVDESIGRGELTGLRDWLRQNLHRHGNKFMPKELIQRVVGGPIDVAPYLRQLREGAAEIYRTPLNGTSQFRG
jgi:carboxypeptidase Taq